jgi:hypothetical protein
MAVALLGGSALLAGCDAMAGTTVHNVDSAAEPKVSVADRIKMIDNDPNMPPAGKEAAKAAVLAHQSNNAQFGAGPGAGVNAGKSADKKTDDKK